MIQTTNHKLVQWLMDEGANLFCNGGFITTAEYMQQKMNITPKESYEILLGCKICEKDKNAIEYEIKKCDGLV